MANYTGIFHRKIWGIEVSRNALRHGLSAQHPPDPASRAQVEALTQAIVAGSANAVSVQAAEEIAEAHVELMRIRSIRAATAATLDLVAADPHALARLQALDRYERLANKKRRRALKSGSHDGVQGPMTG